MLDLEIATSICNNLYHDLNGYTLSAQGRNKLGYHDKAHTYGEVTPAAFAQILKRVESKKGEVFYDLGSGTGKAVLLASMLANFSHCVGIELLKDLHDAAESILHRLQIEIQPYMAPEDFPVVSFYQRDFLRFDFSDADVVFAHSTCFYDELWEHLIRKFEQLQPGTRVISVTKTITSPKLAHFRTEEEAMGWGKATVHFYKRI